jgi:hypothetical protein
LDERYATAVKLLVAVLTAVSAASILPAAQGSAQPQTTAPPQVVNVKITMTDTAFRMSPRVAQRGSVARFILVNIGKKPHTFTLGHEKRGTGAQTGFSRSLKPSEQSVLILFLDYRGVLPYSGTDPADRSKPGMKGTFKII